MLISTENRLKFAMLAILALALSLILIYHQLILKKSDLRQAEQFIFQTGKYYEFEIKSEISKFYSISDFLAIAVSKNIDRPDFDKYTKGLFHDLMVKNSRLHSAELVLKADINTSDTTGFFVNFLDNLSGNSFRYTKLKSGVVEQSEVIDFSSNKLRIAVEKALLTEQTKLLAPEIVQVDGIGLTIIPVLTSIYKGRQFLGYIILNISSDWLSQIKTGLPASQDLLEVFIASPDKSVISLSGNRILLAEPIGKNCMSCEGLLGDKGTNYNATYGDNLLTICIPWKIGENDDLWHTCLRGKANDLPASQNMISLLAFLIGILILAVASFFVVYFFRRYAENWQDLDHLAQKILKGENDLPVPLEEVKETKGYLSLKSSLFKLGGFLNELEKLNKAAVEGDFTREIMPEFESHRLVLASNQLFASLKESVVNFKNEQEKLIYLKKQSEGIEKLNQVLKQYHSDLDQLSTNVVKILVDLLGIEMGAIFLMKTGEDGQYLELVVSYAYSESSFQKRRFKLGESLIGSCAAEKRTLLVKKIPEDYLKIRSGLGLTSPKSILIVPLIFEGNVLGVIELGTIKDFDDFKLEFVEKSAETIANTLSMAEINIRTTELLDKTKQQTLELEERDKKMLEALNELKDLQITTSKSESAIRAKLDAMNNTLMVVEYTAKGILLDANFKYLNTMSYTLEDIKGIDVLELLKEEDRAELIKIINTVKNGNFYEGIIRRPTRHGVDKWLIATYTPVFNEQNVVETILFFAIDISRIRNNEEKLKQKAQELKKQVDDLNKQLSDKA